MDNQGTNAQTQSTASFPINQVQWYSDGPITPPYARTKEGTVILGAGRSGQSVLSVRGTNGSETVRLDKNGVQIKDASGTTVINSTGLVGGNGTFLGTLNIGGGNVIIDGTNKRIIINDGTNDRVLIGFQSGGF